eukprot:gnl/MRDRNA2_/MRDRNA2_78269_c0_seq2.p1 gnl/MRDRNA2_/MRDRNA2_78269_c0~~gnl/MRDRNA2_/MRDRNA2_78269_c0_seq2.p1  ORF type:complete len:111 (-),score=8.84 gnl/MRDRNA2_/MRDRNA2_78269_c0_seq2:32-364(-)
MTTTAAITSQENTKPSAKRVGRKAYGLNIDTKPVQMISQTVRRPPGRPKRESPLTPEEIKERKKKYKNNANELQKEYARFYQHCYYQRPDVKAKKAEYKRRRRAAEREKQ